ncbi:hypothetical protein AB0I81_24080 [Nonomuraea sp. NPDC050404]|uniref:hypothetical protein n=1 Tax=Nonomuraea sp. NPDC050404 TaxID=3155783 RepID=UPI0034027697
MNKKIKNAAGLTLLRWAFAGVTAVSTVAVLGGAAVAAPQGLAAAQQAQQARAGCPSGRVCIYPDRTDNGNPDTYYRYGSYNLSNVFGERLVVNNQTGGAGVRMCRSYGGQNCEGRLGPGRYIINLSPINSILLEP